MDLQSLIKKTDLFIPQVVGDMVREVASKETAFSFLATTDNTLVGKSGDTITIPIQKSISPAEVVAEGAQIPFEKFTQITKTVTVQKIGKGVTFTEEAKISAFSNIDSEKVLELGSAIAQKKDDRILDILKLIKPAMTHTMATGDLTFNEVNKALVKFGNLRNKPKYLFVNSVQYASILENNSAQFINATQLGAEIQMSGVVGMIWGCYLILTDKITDENYIVQPGAIVDFKKKNIEIRQDYDIDLDLYKTTATEHGVHYLNNEMLAIKIKKGTPAK